MTRMDADALRRLFNGPTRSPMWSREGVFLYPPKALWTPLSPQEAAAGWKHTAKNLGPCDFPGLYVHLPQEIGKIAEFFSPRNIHPFIECLQREADIFAVHRKLSFRTLYIGSGGAGMLAHLSAGDIRLLFSWLKKRFNLTSLEQLVVEVDASELTEKKVSALISAGVDRVASLLHPIEGPAGYQYRQAFAEGIRLCRRKGIRFIAIDLGAGRPGQAVGVSFIDAEFVRSLGPDAVHVYDLSARYGRPVETQGQQVPLDRLRELLGASGGSSAVNNLQLSHATAFNGSILGLGWGAVSHIRGRCVYANTDTCFKYAEALLGRRMPAYAGAALDANKERRAHLIRSIEDTGLIDCTAFAKTFGCRPQEAFPAIFAGLEKEGRLDCREDEIYVTGQGDMARYLCSLRFYGAGVLRGLVRAPVESIRVRGEAPQSAAELGAEVGAPRLAVVSRLVREGVTLFASGEIKEAARRFDRALAVDPQDPNALINRGAAAAALADLESALDFFTRAIDSPGAAVDLKKNARVSRRDILKRLGGDAGR